MEKKEIALFKDALGTIKAGVDMLNKLVDTSEQQQESDHTDEENLNEVGKDPRKKDPDNHHVEQFVRNIHEEIVVGDRIEFCEAVLEDNKTTSVVGFCFNRNTHEAYGRVDLEMDLLKEMAKLYLNAHEQ